MRPDPKTEVLVLVTVLGWLVVIYQAFTFPPRPPPFDPMSSTSTPEIAPGHWSNVLQHPITRMTPGGEVLGKIATTGSYYLEMALPPGFEVVRSEEAGMPIETTTVHSHLVAKPRPGTPGAPIKITDLGQFKALFGQHGFGGARPKVIVSLPVLAFIQAHSSEDAVCRALWREADLYLSGGDVRTSDMTTMGCTKLKLVVHD